MMNKFDFKKQDGMTFLGLVLMVAAGVFVAIIAMKLTPAYIEFAGVKKAIKTIANNPDFDTMGDKDIVTSFNKAAEVGYIKVISGKELAITKTDSGKVVSAEYQVLIPIVANVSVLLDFKASTAK
jgi:hypothetical protein